MTLDPSIPSHLLESARETPDPPRATRLTASVLTAVRTELWMGGVHTSVGEPMHPAHLGEAWVVDCAGELPASIVAGAARHLPRVFADIEAVPSNLGRIDALVVEIAEALRGAQAPGRVYVMCQQGLNRSGLVTALLLRALGAASDEALETIRRARPGALNNVTFAELVRRPPRHDA